MKGAGVQLFQKSKKEYGGGKKKCIEMSTVTFEIHSPLPPFMKQNEKRLLMCVWESHTQPRAGQGVNINCRRNGYGAVSLAAVEQSSLTPDSSRGTTVLRQNAE